ncbi:MAG: Hsp20/alpha crystallin family protein [Candidatus Omnitrophica bacterium]|nr:Hsp20/alpha crystallin family protein [Candidatus Omnitrophota bacterium]
MTFVNQNREEIKKSVTPYVTIQETEKEVVLKAEMAGLQKEDIQVELIGDELTIKGSQKECEVPKGYTPIMRERCLLEYRRAFILGDEVDKGKINADYENGILTVTLTKSEKTQPKKIVIT